MSRHLSICVPLNAAVVDERMDRWVKTVKTDILYVTALVPKHYGVGSKLRVTITVKANAVIQKHKV